MESKHTPEPLCVHTNDRGFEVHSCTDEYGMVVLADCYDEDFANRIVRACNAHDELVALALAVVEHFKDTDAPLGIAASYALAKAGGES